MQANQIPSDYTRWGSFETLIEETNKKIKLLFDAEDDKSDKNWTKVSTMWNQGNDETTLNNTDVKKSIGDMINDIANVKNCSEMTVTMAKLYMNGITSVLDFGANPDLKNSQQNILWIDRNNLGLPDRDFYFNDKMTEKVAAYKLFMVESLDYLKLKFDFDVDSNEMSKNIFDLEMKLAESMMTMSDRRDPTKIYNPTNLTELKDKYSNVDWDGMFAAINVVVGNNLISNQEPKFLEMLNMLLTDENLDVWKYYSMLKVIWSLYQFLDDEINNMCFNFYGTQLNGQTTQKPRWKRVMAVNDALVGELVGKKYCSLYFTEESKNMMLQMISNILKTFEDRISNLTWMSDETKEKAKEKINKLGVKVGYPNKWENFDDLNVTETNTYCQNIMESYKLKVKKNLEMCYRQVDKEKWGMYPHQINAYYDPSQNEIAFPAGILQAPFFDKNQPAATNYGGIGAVISHEIGHAFDDSGSQFDADGNLNNWWTDQDKENYNSATKKMEEQFNNYTMEGMNLNGNLCLGENIADYCGVIVSINSLLSNLNSTDGDKNDQMKLFFESYATIWRNNIRPDALKNRIVVDPHSPGYYRVNGILSNIPHFYELYNVTENDKMYLEPNKRTVLW